MDMSDEEDSDLEIDIDDDDEEEEALFTDNEEDDDDDDEDKNKNKNSNNNDNQNNDDNKEESQNISEEKHVDMLSSELAAEFAKYKQEIMENQISHKIFTFLKEIKSRAPKDTTKPNEKADIFPLRPGSHLPLQDPALEFVKYICLVLSLDKDIEEEVGVLRKNLLRIIDVGSFGESAKFVNPCCTYILPDVNCFKCKQSRDLDLCRDPFTRPEILQTRFYDEDDDVNNGDSWNVKCNQCGTLYNKDLVESMLLDVVRRRETAYHVQDIICKSCGKAKEDDMSEYCQCSGQFKNKESRKEFEKNMKTFYNIGIHYNFEYLTDTLEWIIN